ncbi:DUF1295 domain-containing protein [Arthrobacter sp. NicSoilB8]|uniref:DUF1295 domain-containing protein n=1 Tax=Arthrobacter sp. NicSoilB8 TaxID=2830998 RepID=UPI001CC46A72|nr:DUF1295 domain-containing protein [Arthrobacter sp. NicSoilB8]BCW69925.1 hypothetical protein NicSoilB8_09690 [Arthrobacter sp. NicSoilB8]
MRDSDRKALTVTPAVVLLAALVALAGSQHGATLGGVPIFAMAVGAAFLTQWLVFVPSFRAQTEKFYDLTGSLTYIAITVLLVLLTPGIDARALLLAAMVLAWAMRLGSFLFRRISKAGKDDRFDEIKPSFVRFLNVWTIQGLWVVFTAAAAWVAITAETKVGLDWFALAGFLVWAAGFGIEVVADAQKSRFNADPANKGRFISTGLWAKSRHPNYFGEILLWLGVAIIAVPVLQGWQWVALISPVFVTLLITKVSGVPLLEKKSDSKWGGQPDYEAYKSNTPVLIPKL